jgi:hypothetical protein
MDGRVLQGERQMESSDHARDRVEKLSGKIFALLIILLFGFPLNAQTSLKIARAENAPKIDGVLSEGEWKNAVRVELTHQYEPQQSARATERTEAFLMFDKEFLYIAFRAFDSNPSAIRAPVSKRDAVGQDDFVSLWLDTFDDRRRTYAFRFNPLGVQEDGILTDSGASDFSWDGIFESKGSLTADGYAVEAAIPFKTLRFQINERKTWGLHLFRKIARKNESTSWMQISPDKQSFLIQMGSLEGLDGIFAGRTLDVIPTVTVSNTGTRERDATAPTGARLNTVNKLDPGLTAIYTLTPNLTLSATINPDFSQIENDVPQISVNQRFPLFFSERRPFFQEGAEVFRPFYSAAPRLIDTRQIVDPDWGVKLTGKIGKNTIGILSASDDAAGLRLAPTNENYGKNALFNIVRASRDVFRQSTVGFSLTDRHFAGATNTVGTLDGRIRFGEDKQLFAYQVSYSKTKESDGTRREGGLSYFAYTYEDRKWSIGTTHSGAGRNFRAQTGFVRRTGYLRSYGYVYRAFRPKEKSWWVKMRPFVVALAFRDQNGNFDESFLDPGVDLEFARGITVYTYFSTRRDNFLGRGYTTRAYVGNFSVNAFKRFSIRGRIETGTGVNFDAARPEIGNLLNGELNVTLRPLTKLNSEFLWLKSSLKSREGGENLFAQDIFRNRTVYQFNRFHAARSIAEYDTLQRRIVLSFLYAYTPRPNTAVYVGYGDALYNGVDPLNFRRQSGLFRQSRSLFAKFSYNFRF